MIDIIILHGASFRHLDLLKYIKELNIASALTPLSPGGKDGASNKDLRSYITNEMLEGPKKFAAGPTAIVSQLVITFPQNLCNLSSKHVIQKFSMTYK